MAASYEQLRSAVVEGRGGGWRHGWSVLVRSGMAAWSRAIAALRGPVGQQPDRPPVPALDVADHLATELVHVLASLVLGHGRPP
ncbi:hypothetical protein ACWDA7_39415 [Streptomyces sp. NPDC001156]